MISFFNRLVARIWAVFRSSEFDRELQEELDTHVKLRTEDLIRQGIQPKQAERTARVELGGITQLREAHRETRAFPFVDTVRQDLRYTLRTMRKSPVFTATIVLTLALGIGGNTAAFSVVDGLLLKPLHYRHPDRLVEITADYPRRDIWDTTFTKLQFDKLQKEQRCFAGIGVFLYSTETVTISGNGEPEALKGARVSANFLGILGVAPALGRSFLPEEETRGGPAVVMISDELWHRRFGGSARILGESIDLNSTPYTIVGVLPEGFTFPMPGVDVWMTKPSEWSVFTPRTWDIITSLKGFARLKRGVTLEQANAQMDVLNRRAAKADSGLYVPRMRVTPLRDHLVANIRPTLWILFGVVTLVLLIACVNVANLMLVRTKSRAREFAIRIALGAPGGRLMRQLLTESVLLSLLGGSIGLLWAEWAVVGISHISLLNLPGVSGIQLDGTVFAFTLVVSITTGILCGLFPALQLLRRQLASSLRESGATAARGQLQHFVIPGFSIRGLLVVVQVAMSIVLLIGAMLLLKSFIRLQNVNPGFQPSGLLTAKIALPPLRYDGKPKKIAFADEALQRVQHLPGVRSAAMAMSLPATTWFRTNVQVQGKPWEPNPGNWPSVQIQSVTPNYFRTLQIPIERGREFTRLDNSVGAPETAIINESFARRFWPAYPRGDNPIGEHLREGADKTGWLEIIGIVADVHEGGLAMHALPEFYVPWTLHSPQTSYIVLRTDRNPLRLGSAVRKQVHAIDPNVAMSDIQTMDDVLKSTRTLGQRRLAMWLVTSFAAVAFLLAVIGVYGVVAYSVTQRTQEFGVRQALGAQKGDIFRIVLGNAFVLALSGALFGMFGALALTRLIKSLLFQVTTTDPVTFLSAAVLSLVVVLGASFLPARRAAKTDPMQALRVE